MTAAAGEEPVLAELEVRHVEVYGDACLTVDDDSIRAVWPVVLARSCALVLMAC